ncbi:iron ABC transporter permease [Streptomyces radicis]|uniref:Iron ABC transporter permease n=2 Tax=Streptomyces radicis TaxID=1750517 RepID=A0A3A9WID4_9ACTN|nr:iron ABC transporter permease [Streptomyces radicis]RKN12951.1 iron ABC transporter permease [Streptomyces radicis]RKN27835.1 iron ABC transporter permease [Streptomyces radicis]
MSAVLAVPAAVTAAFALLPLVYLTVRSLEHGFGYAWDIVADGRTAHLLVRSLSLALVVVAASVLIGVSLAWLTERTALPAPRLWAVLATLPLAVPSYVMAFSWLSAFPSLAGFRGAALVLSLACSPYVYLPVAAALRGIDPAQEEAARSLGHGALGVFLRITLPQLRHAVGGGALLVALYVVADFGAVSLMRYDTFTRAIHTSYRASFDRTPAAVLSCVLVLLTALLVLAERRARGRARLAGTGRGSPRPAERLPLGRLRGPAVGWCALVAGAAVAFPLGSLGYWIAQGTSATWDPAELADTAWATARLAAAGAALTILLALPVGVVAARHRTRTAHLLEQASFAGHALPGITVALAMVFLSVRYAYALYQQWPLLVMAYAMLFLPLAVTAVRTAVLQAPPELEYMARSLGRGPLGTLRAVTVPLAAPGIATGAALTFVVIMKELPATLLLRPTGMDTLATRLWTHTGVAAYAAAAPYALALILIAAVPSYLLGRHR